MSQHSSTPGEFYVKQFQPELEDELAKLSPAQQRLYAIRMATDPPRPMRECATIVGKKISTLEKTWKEIRARLGRDPLSPWKEKGVLPSGGGENFERLRSVSTDTLVKLSEMRAEAMLRGITLDKVNSASLRDLTSGYRELINARQLLKGEPTQILQVNQRENLRRLLPMAIKRLQKMGVTLEVDGSGSRFVKQIEAVPESAEPEAPEPA